MKNGEREEIRGKREGPESASRDNIWLLSQRVTSELRPGAYLRADLLLLCYVLYINIYFDEVRLYLFLSIQIQIAVVFFQNIETTLRRPGVRIMSRKY